MSVQGELYDFLNTLAKGATDQTVHITPDAIALQSGFERDKVNKTLNNLMTRKRLELLRAENGRNIIGYKMLEPPPDKRRGGMPKGGPRAVQHERRMAQQVARTNGAEKLPTHRRRTVYTPQLDAYLAQKKKFQILTEELGDRVEASFKEDPLAEEALLIKERLELTEEQLFEWRARAEEAERDVKALRTRHEQAVTRKAIEEGAVVQHSVD